MTLMTAAGTSKFTSFAGNARHTYIFQKYKSIAVLDRSLALSNMKIKKPLDKKTKEVILKVYQFFADLEIEGDPEALINKLKPTLKVASSACGISLTCMNRIIHEKRTVDAVGLGDGTFSEPGHGCPTDNWVIGLDDFDVSTVRKMAMDYVEKGEYPAAAKIAERMSSDMNLKLSPSSAVRILKMAGFRYQKTKDRLVEKPEVLANRMGFLAKMHSLEVDKDTRPIVYLAEAWINENHSKDPYWTDVSEAGELKIQIGKGSRLVVVLAGSEKHGFFEDAELVFRASGSKDHHKEFDAVVFKKWFIDLLQSLDEGCIIIMDQTSYNTKLQNEMLFPSWLQNEKNGATISEDRRFLMGLELDELANVLGHELICPPPYHCQYSPIASIWSQIKKYVAENNATLSIEDVEDHFYKAISMVTPEDWKTSTEQANRNLAEDFLKQGLNSSAVEQMLVDSFKNEPFSSSDDEFC